MGLTYEQNNKRVNSKKLEKVEIVNPWNDKEQGNYFFISYKSDDWEIVLEDIVYKLQKEYGLRIYYDRAFESDNKNWLTQMEAALENTRCKGVLAFISPNYLKSYATLMELLYTTHWCVKGKREKEQELDIIPIFLNERLEDCLKIHMNNKSSLEMKTNEINKLKELIEYLDPKYKLIKDIIKINDQNTTVTYDKIALAFKEFFKNNGDGLNGLPCIGDFYGNLIKRIERIDAQVFDENLKNQADNTETNYSINEDVIDKCGVQEELDMEEADESFNEESKEEKRAKSVTGDIAFSIYGKDFLDNQTGVMLRVFHDVMARHTDKIPELLDKLSCLSSIDYTKAENKKTNMKSYFRVCEYFTYSDGSSICVGTAYSWNDKLRLIAKLLFICNEDSIVLQGIELPEIKKVSDNKQVNEGSEGNIKFSVYDRSYTYNQAGMMFQVFHDVIEKHTDKIHAIVEKCTCADYIDFTQKVNRTPQMKPYFNSCRFFTFQDGTSICIGTSYSYDEKRKLIAKLLEICNESWDILTGIEVPESRVSKREKRVF